MTVATKVDALMMSTNMCMNNMTCVAFIAKALCCIMIHISVVSGYSGILNINTQYTQISVYLVYFEIIIKLHISISRYFLRNFLLDSFIILRTHRKKNLVLEK